MVRYVARGNADLKSLDTSGSVALRGKATNREAANPIHCNSCLTLSIVSSRLIII